MATLSISSWTLTPLNADGTDNTLLTELSGSVPTTEICDFGAMGSKFKLVLDCQYSGTYSDSSTADVLGSIIRFNPALFVEQYSTYFAPNTFPNNGFILQIPSTSLATYPMALSFANNQFSNTLENGVCTLEVTSSTEFTITYEFRMTFDIENYLIGQSLDNRSRLTKSNAYNVLELNNDRPSVYSITRALNAIVASKQRNNTLFAEELSIGFIASFNGLDTTGTEIAEMTVSFRANDDPSTILDHPSSFEDTLVTLSFDDPDEVITTEEITVILTKRNLTQNVAGFSKDLDLKELKLETTASTGTISGPFKGPVSYVQTGGVTSVSFVLDHSQLVFNTDYDFHAIATYQRDVSDNALLHYVLKDGTGSDSLPLNFDISSEFFSRNGNHAESFTATVMERIANVLTMNMTQYDNEATQPYTNFNSDIQWVKFELKTIFGNVLYSGQILKNSNDNSWTDNGQIHVTIGEGDDEGLIFFTAQPFRIPYENFQNLPNLGGNATNAYVFTWSIRFTASADDNAQIEYRLNNDLTIRQYENAESVPSGAPKVDNIRFIDPTTGFQIGAWCDLETVLVMADVDDLGSDTYVEVFIDQYPLGVLYQNDMNLEEVDPAEHSADLPLYVEFEQLDSDLVSNLDANPTDGVISFLLDITNLTEADKYRISILAYRANP